MLNMLKHSSFYSSTPSFLETLKKSREFEDQNKHGDDKEFRITIVSNFTDDLLHKLITGLCVSEGIHPNIYSVPFKQYFFEFKNPKSKIYAHNADITFIFFDINAYKDSEFITDPAHLEEIIKDLQSLCGSSKGSVVIHTCIEPSDIQYRRLFKGGVTETLIHRFNTEINEIVRERPNVHILETQQLAQTFGSAGTYDMRSLFAFSQPFTSDFLFAVSIEWFAYIRTLLGKMKKCLVLDLDNTLWGGIVGEVGPLGIDLGPDYPGNAYVAFQKTILEYYNHGIILAINSRNNEADVKEVFEKNPNMVLKEHHFALIVTNWESKADNLKHIALELNISLDSLVFIDDDAMNRDLVKTQLPEVVVPDFSFPPEEYSHALLNINEFHALSLTKEDKQRGEMYAAERLRKEVQSEALSAEDYIASLDIHLDIHLNDEKLMTRLSQMTQKTNQFNLTTIRQTEVQLTELIKNGALVYSSDIHDKFGAYGTTIMGILRPLSDSEVILDNMLMSCRVMGRDVEFVFFDAIVDDLQRRGYSKIHASYIRTAKNAPAAEYLQNIGGVQAITTDEGIEKYVVDLVKLGHKKDRKIQVTTHFNT